MAIVTLRSCVPSALRMAPALAVRRRSAAAAAAARSSPQTRTTPATPSASRAAVSSARSALDAAARLAAAPDAALASSESRNSRSWSGVLRQLTCRRLKRFKCAIWAERVYSRCLAGEAVLAHRHFEPLRFVQLHVLDAEDNAHRNAVSTAQSNRQRRLTVRIIDSECTTPCDSISPRDRSIKANART